jgi:hypothetical protein
MVLIYYLSPRLMSEIGIDGVDDIILSRARYESFQKETGFRGVSCRLVLQMPQIALLLTWKLSLVFIQMMIVGKRGTMLVLSFPCRVIDLFNVALTVNSRTGSGQHNQD